jgi:hypothetical protein
MILDKSDENFFFTDYRNSAVDVGTVLLAITMMMVGLSPEMFHLGSAVVAGVSAVSGLVLAGLVIWASQRLFSQDRALDLSQQKVVEVTCFTKWLSWHRVRVLAEFNDIITVYLNPRIDMWSRYHQWTYPIVLLTRDGQSITVSNRASAADRDNYSIPRARQLSEMLGCEVHISDERTPLQVVRRGQEFSFEPKTQDVGFVGVFLVLSLLGGLVWLLLSLVP